jgi:hypothetical protein
MNGDIISALLGTHPTPCTGQQQPSVRRGGDLVNERRPPAHASSVAVVTEFDRPRHARACHRRIVSPGRVLERAGPVARDAEWEVALPGDAVWCARRETPADGA